MYASETPSKSESSQEALHARIALEAYRIWEQEGRPQGRERDHWNIAEEFVLRSQETIDNLVHISQEKVKELVLRTQDQISEKTTPAADYNGSSNRRQKRPEKVLSGSASA